MGEAEIRETRLSRTAATLRNLGALRRLEHHQLTHFISVPDPRRGILPRADVTGLREWSPARRASPSSGTTIASAASATGLRETLMVIAYENGLARRSRHDIQNVPAVIGNRPHRDRGTRTAAAACPCSSTRDQRAGSGGIIKHDARRRRRARNSRAWPSSTGGSPRPGRRIAWFEQAAEGNDLPRAEYW